MVVVLALLMWMPVCGPIPEFQISPIGKCIYLFLQSIVPTIPAAWLTFAEGTVYEAYDVPLRLMGIGVTEDQQIAGAIMKLGGGVFLWTLVVIIYFKQFASGYRNEHNYRRRGVDADRRDHRSRRGPVDDRRRRARVLAVAAARATSRCRVGRWNRRRCALSAVGSLAT